MKYSDLQTIPKRFRIWDTLHKRWFQGGTSNQDRSLGTDAVDLFGEIAVFGALFHDQNCMKDSDDWEGIGFIEMIKYLVCVQSTGLKDKNGREIFEGDIVEKRYSNDEAFNGVRAVCFYDIEAAEFDFESMYRSDDVKNFIEEYTVVGNIFENPELLEEKNGK